MKKILLTLAAFGVCLLWQNSSSHAQGGLPNNPPQNTNSSSDRIKDEETKDHWWDCNLPGGNYCVNIGKITSVSLHEYAVPMPTQTPGAVPLPTRVFEVNIATDTALVTRFYYVEAATEASALNVTKTAVTRINQIANEAANRTGSLKVWQMVQKDYPQTTHAHTIEYRLETRDDLNRLFGSVKRSWLTGRGARFSVNPQ